MTRQPARRDAAPKPHGFEGSASDELGWAAAEGDAGRARASRRTAKPDGAGPAGLDYEALVAATAASERRAIETAAKTAAALGSVASWIERAQAQLAETTQAATRSQEGAATLIQDAVGTLDQRLSAVENRAGESTATAGDALKAIERIETRLATQPAVTEPASGGFEAALSSFESRIGALTDRISSLPRPIGRRGLKPDTEIRSAVEEIRSHQAQLDSEPGVVRTDRAALPALNTLARSQTAILTTLRADVAKLAHRLDEPPAAAAAPAEVHREIKTLRESMAASVTRSDVEKLESGIRTLTADIADLRAAGERATALPEIQALQDEVRRLADQPKGGDTGPITRDLEKLSHKLDLVAASGVDPGTVGTLARQVEEVRQLLSSAAAPQALSLVSTHLADLRRELAELGGRQVDGREFAALKATVDDMGSAIASLRAEPAATFGVASEAGASIEATLAVLVDKLDRVERRVADPDALNGLERQIQHLAARMSEGPVGSDRLDTLEDSMAALLTQIASWQDGAIATAEHAARTAVLETVGAMPVASEVERHLAEMSDRYLAAEERTRDSLGAVHATLEDVMARIGQLEATGPERAATSVAPGHVPEFSARSAPVPPPPPLPLSARPAPVPSDAPGPEDEVLLEPGARRPTVPPLVAATAAAAAPSDPADIKASFIAAARRAAQAAQAETAQPARTGTASGIGARLSGLSPAEILRRVRSMIDEKRRPLLLSAAALVLAVGTVQIVRNATTETAAPAPARIAAAPVPAARPVAPTSPTPSAAPASPAPAPQPAVEAVAPATLPDPTATGAIGERIPVTPTPIAVPAEPAPARPIEATAAAAPPLPPTLAVAGRAVLQPDPATVVPSGLRSAATAGDPVALYELALRTADGRGVTRDPKGAAALFEKAAEKGLAPAQYRIGNIYERGIGVPRDVDAAKRWYRRAAEAGNVRAMHNLAVLSADSSGARADYAAAIQWFTKAAEHGLRDSQFNLAVLYARGLGTGQDLARSYHWLALAAMSGDEDAGKKRDEVGARLAPSELSRAKSLVASWKATALLPGANDVTPPSGGWPEAPAPVKRASRDGRA